MDRSRVSRVVALDVVLALAVAAAGSWYAVAQSVPGELLLRSPVAVQVVVQLVAAACLLARRRHPLQVGVVVAVLCVAVPVHAAALAAYSATAHGGRRRWAVGVSAGVLLGWCLGARVWDLGDPWSVPLLVTLASVLGLYVRARRALVGVLLEQAVARERERLAAEMHDVVSHRLGLVVLHAGALSARVGDRGVQREIEEIRAQGAAALSELRDVFGVLRTSPTGAVPAAPGPGAPATDGLDEVLQRWRDAGLDVVRTGDGDLTRLDPAAARTACRIVQEGLTNAAKHAPGAPVALHAGAGGGAVTVRLWNAGPRGAPDPALAGSGSGRGLAGLAERVQMVGGSLTWGPERDGGFVLTGRLPELVAGGRGVPG